MREAQAWPRQHSGEETDDNRRRLQKRHQTRAQKATDPRQPLRICIDFYYAPMWIKRLAMGLISPLGVTLMLQANSAIANPLTVTVGGTDYQVEKFTGSISDLLSSSLLTPPPSENFPWWDDSNLAVDFTTAYNTADGGTVQQVMSNGIINVTFGPLFYLSDSSGDVTFGAWNFDNAAYDAGLCNVQFDCSITSLKWAYVQSPAAPVPAPIPLLGAAAAFTSSRRLRRRLNARKFTF